jgi:hypothetical protein
VSLTGSSLQIQPFWNISPLTIESLFLRLREVFLRDSHSSLSQRQETRLCADCFDISSRELIFRHDEDLQVDVLRERHLPGVDLKDSTLGFDVRKRKLDFANRSRRVEREREREVEEIYQKTQRGGG